MPYIKGVFWYDFQDDGWKSNSMEDNFGVTRPDLTPKKQFFTMKDIAPFIKRAAFKKRIDAGDPNIWVLQYAMPDGKYALALWSVYPDDDYQITLKNGIKTNAPITFTIPGEGNCIRRMGTRDWVTNAFAAKVIEDQFQLCLRGKPVILEGELERVEVIKTERRKFQEKDRPKNHVVIAPELIVSASKKGSAKLLPGIELSEENHYRTVSGQLRNGKNDLSAKFQIQWDENNIYIIVNVEDDIFCQKYQGDKTWQGDGLQIAFQEVSRQNGIDPEKYAEFDIALTAQGPKVFREYPNPALETAIDCKISSCGNMTVYELKIPAERAGLPKLSAGSIIAFSLLINDNDGNERKGYLHWGDGIGQEKNPALYNWIKLED